MVQFNPLSLLKFRTFHHSKNFSSVSLKSNPICTPASAHSYWCSLPFLVLVFVLVFWETSVSVYQYITFIFHFGVVFLNVQQLGSQTYVVHFYNRVILDNKSILYVWPVTQQIAFGILAHLLTVLQFTNPLNSIMSFRLARFPCSPKPRVLG